GWREGRRRVCITLGRRADPGLAVLRRDEGALPAGIVVSVEDGSLPHPAQGVQDNRRGHRRIEAGAAAVFDKIRFEDGAKPDRLPGPPPRPGPDARHVSPIEPGQFRWCWRLAGALAKLHRPPASPGDIVRPTIVRTPQGGPAAPLAGAGPAARASGPETGCVDVLQPGFSQIGTSR